MVRSMRALPPGVEVYSFTADGEALLVNRDGTADLGSANDLLRFIDDGQAARYFIGDQATSPLRPSNATYKLGIVRGHSAFTPHAHRGEHFVLSLGFAACGLYHPDRQAVLDVRLPPGTMIRIPAMLPHSFANRAGRPLLVLAANTGYGIDHDDYAITAVEAERRATAEPAAGPAEDYPALAKALRALEHGALEHGASGQGAPGLTRRERAAAALRRLATRLERRP
jgi:hypothetical protein